MTITETFSDPFYTGGSVADLVPSVYPVALNGRPYMVDTQPETYYVRWNAETIPLLRSQADSAKSPAETSLNPSGLWRRAQDSFHNGAGQVYRDRDGNEDPYRFHASKGVDVWTRYQLSLLPDTDQKVSSANTNLQVVSAGSRCYYADGTALKYTADITPDSPSFSTVTGTSGGSITALASDGFNVYIGSGSSGIYKTDTSVSVAAAFVTGSVNGPVAYVKSRLLCGNGPNLYNPTGAGALPTPLFTHNNAGFGWVGFAEGVANIYAAGYAGDKSQIYRIAVKPDASALDAPIIAGELPDGELVTSISGYLGFVFIGTTKGVRFCEVDGQGNLTIGPVVETQTSVRAFEPQDSFMWFGWSDYDATSTGLGRVDLRSFVATDQPAHASDLMVTGSGDILSIATFNDLRVFTVSGLGLYAETSTFVTSGNITTGCASFGIPDPKTGISVAISTSALAGSYTVDLAVDDGAFAQIGSEAVTNSTVASFPLSGRQAERYELRINLTQASSTSGPTLLRWTLKVLPTTADGPAEIFHIPILLANPLEIRHQEYFCDVQRELDEFSALRASRQVVQYQQFDATYTVIVSDFKFFPYGLTDEPDDAFGVKGTISLDLQRVQ